MTFLYYASDSFASRAKVLTDSIEKYHPGAKIVHVKPKDGPIGTYLAGMAKERLQKALELLEAGDKAVIVIGADCELFQPMHELNYFSGVWTDADIALVPHVTKPVASRDAMAQFYRTGHANADLMAFRNTNNAKYCLEWLISVTEGEEKGKGIFYEQTWLSAVPFLFPRVHIIRDRSYNVAYFNILERDFKYIGDVPYVGSGPVTMVQYSGYVKDYPEKMSKYSGVRVTGDILRLYKDYDVRIEK